MMAHCHLRCLVSPKIVDSSKLATEVLVNKIRRGNIYRRKMGRFSDELIVLALRFDIGTTGRPGYVSHYIQMYAYNLKTLTPEAFWWTEATASDCIYAFFADWELISEVSEND